MKRSLRCFILWNSLPNNVVKEIMLILKFFFLKIIINFKIKNIKLGSIERYRNAVWNIKQFYVKQLEIQCESESHSIVLDSLRPHGLYSPWNSLCQNTGAGHLSLLQGIFSTQGLNPGLLHYRWILYQLSPREASIDWHTKKSSLRIRERSCGLQTTWGTFLEKLYLDQVLTSIRI